MNATKMLQSKLGQTEGFWKIILLILAILTVIAVGVIYYYSTAQAERGLYNITRVLRGAR